MIIPYFRGVDRPHRIPVTWTLVFINCFIFFYCSLFTQQFTNPIEHISQDQEFFKTQGRIYADFVLEHPERYSEVVRFKAKEAIQGSESALRIMGARLALQDGFFSDEILKKNLKGDDIAIQNWKVKFVKFSQSRYLHPTFLLGINYYQRELSNLISYQFSHSGLMHLAFNMFFLLIFGTLLEPVLGGVVLLLAYLIGGIFAGYGFWAYAGLSAIPLVGSSGSISALIGIAFAMFFSKKAKFFYFLGFIRLPMWAWALYFWLLLDFAGLLKVVPGFSGQIAHSAHISGTLAGYTMGLLILLSSRTIQDRVETTGHELLQLSRV